MRILDNVDAKVVAIEEPLQNSSILCLLLAACKANIAKVVSQHYDRQRTDSRLAEVVVGDLMSQVCSHQHTHIDVKDLLDLVRNQLHTS